MKIVVLCILVVIILGVVLGGWFLLLNIFKDEFNEFDELWKDESIIHHLNDRWYDGF